VAALLDTPVENRDKWTHTPRCPPTRPRLNWAQRKREDCTINRAGLSGKDFWISLERKKEVFYIIVRKLKRSCDSKCSTYDENRLYYFKIALGKVFLVAIIRALEESLFVASTI